jgi:hypothetical protein
MEHFFKSQADAIFAFTQLGKILDLPETFHADLGGGQKASYIYTSCKILDNGTVFVKYTNPTSKAQVVVQYTDHMVVSYEGRVSGTLIFRALFFN